MSVVIIGSYIILTSSVAPVYVVSRLGMKFYPNRNKTLIGLVFTEDRVAVEKVTFAINNVFIPAASFFVIIISTTILVAKLQNQTQWRSKSTFATQASNVSSRNQKMTKMIVMISLLFIACFLPVIFLFAAISADRRFSITGKFKNVLIIFGGVGIVLESINSASNIFIYYYMSSNYRVIFQRLFFFRQEVHLTECIVYTMFCGSATWGGVRNSECSLTIASLAKFKTSNLRFELPLPIMISRHADLKLWPVMSRFRFTTVHSDSCSSTGVCLQGCLVVYSTIEKL